MAIAETDIGYYYPPNTPSKAYIVYSNTGMVLGASGGPMIVEGSIISLISQNSGIANVGPNFNYDLIGYHYAMKESATKK